MRCRYREKLYDCGRYMEVSIYPVYRTAGCRSRKAKPTPEMMKKVNDLNAENKLIRILNANFTEDDLKVELTYREGQLPEDDDMAARELTNFLRRLKNYRRKKQLPELKYIAVTEKGVKNGRYHHHLIINGGFEVKELVKLWGRGYVHTDSLQFNNNGLADLGRYMIKKSIVSKKKWNSSKNLVHPKAKIRDGRLSNRRVMELSKNTDDGREYEKYFKGYFFSEARKVYNDVNGGVYIYARFYRKEDDNNAIRTTFKRKC